MSHITADEARRLREEIARLRSALQEAAGLRGSTCTSADPEMTDAEWTRRQWRNAIDQWKFWHEAYEADIGKPEFIGSWRGWRENALRLAAEVERLSADNERLREALRVVASNMLALEDGGCDYPRVVESFRVARTSLADEGGEG